MKQTIGNACGTIALLHGLGNNRHNLPIGGHTWTDHAAASVPLALQLFCGLLLHPVMCAVNLPSNMIGRSLCADTGSAH